MSNFRYAFFPMPYTLLEDKENTASRSKLRSFHGQRRWSRTPPNGKRFTHKNIFVNNFNKLATKLLSTADFKQKDSYESRSIDELI